MSIGLAIGGGLLAGIAAGALKKGREAGDDASTAALMSDRQWAEEQAQKQMDFQKMMSDTSWQRAVEDMQKAGLNPALAYHQGGASSAAGASAQTGSTDQKAAMQRERLLYSLAHSALQVAGRAAGAKDVTVENYYRQSGR